jgi:AbrB family looped-hinge helix DNA binding protein
VKLTSKGQVTIPIDVREQLGLHPGDEIKFVLDEHSVRIVKDDQKPTRGRRIVEQLRGKGTANLEMTTDEIMALVRGE